MLNEPNWDELWKNKSNGYDEKLGVKHLVVLEAIKHIEARERVSKISTIADFGCGYGNILKELAKENKYKLFAYDQSDFAGEELESRGIKFQKCNLLDMEQYDLRYDIAIITDVLEHFFNQQKF